MIKRLARCIREYKWASLGSPLCMIGEVTMEVLIPLVNIIANIREKAFTRITNTSAKRNVKERGPFQNALSSKSER